MPPPLPFNPYTCDPCLGDPQCENVTLEDSKMYKRWLMRTLCAIKALIGGGGPAGYATEGTLLVVNGKITACDTGAVTITSMPSVNVSSLPAVTGSVTVSNAAGASAVNIQDGGNSITVDGSVSVSSIPAVTGSVTVSNAAGASAVNIQDGGNSITVDGSVSVSAIPAISGSVTVSNAAGASAVNIQDGGNSITVDGSVGVSGSVTVSNAAGASAVNIQDGGNSITVDGSLSATITSGTLIAQMQGYNGAAWEDVYSTQHNLRTMNQTYLQGIAEGYIANHTPWTKIGYSPSVSTSESDVWSAGGTYTFPASASTWEVVSSDNTQDIGTSIFSGNSDSGSTTSLGDSTKNFLGGTPVAVGDCIVLDKSGATPEWGYVTAVAATVLTVAGGFSSGGSGNTRAYTVVDKSAHTNAQVVKIDYLDTAFAQHSEIILLNGTTAVPAVNNNFYRCNSFRIIAAGTNAKPLGNLTLRASPGGTTYSYILLGFTRARNSAYTVPAGKTLYVVQFSAGWASTSNQIQFGRIYTRANIEPSTSFNTGSIFYPYTELMLSNTAQSVLIECPTKLSAGTDIKISGLGSAAGACSTVLRGWLES